MIETLYTSFSWSELEDLDSGGMTKGMLAKKIGITCSFDTALPQEWLDGFVKRTGLDYHQVLYSCFMIYEENDTWGRVVSAWSDCMKALNLEKAEYILDTIVDHAAVQIASDIQKTFGAKVVESELALVGRLSISIRNIFKEEFSELYAKEKDDTTD